MLLNTGTCVLTRGACLARGWVKAHKNRPFNIVTRNGKRFTESPSLVEKPSPQPHELQRSRLPSPDTHEIGQVDPY